MTHDRNDVKRPNEITNKITKLLQESAQLMEILHHDYDGITVKIISTGCGDTWVKLEKRD